MGSSPIDLARQAIIVPDPVKALPLGSQIRFNSRLFPSDMPHGLNDVRDWEYLSGTVLALQFGRVSNPRVLGCGVIVAPGVALAAKHVVEPEIEAVRGGDGFICTAMTSAGIMVWAPQQVTPLLNTDLCILTLEYRSPLPDAFHQAVITTRLPKVGETIFIAGQRCVGSSATAEGITTLEIRTIGAAGKVTAQYVQGRDSVMAPGPALEVECPALGGMSGGPAFDRAGYLLGLLSSSWEPDGPATISLLWPALAVKVAPGWPDGLHHGAASLLEMDRGICPIQRPDALRVRWDADSGSPITEYLPWEDL